MNPTISIITLNINDLKASIRRQRWLDSTICCLQEIYFKNKDIYRLKESGWVKIDHASTNQKRSEELH